MSRILVFAASVLVVLLLASMNTPAQTILDQVRLGNYTEDMTVYQKGKRIAFVDGYGIYSVREVGKGLQIRVLGIGAPDDKPLEAQRHHREAAQLQRVASASRKLLASLRPR